MNDKLLVGKCDFGAALRRLKDGHRVRREGWNGKGMWLALTPGMKEVPADKFWNVHNAAFARGQGGSAEVLPYITMKTADDKIVPWLASQTDVLAEDWQILQF